MYKTNLSTIMDHNPQHSSDYIDAHSDFWNRKSGGRVLRNRKQKRQFDEQRPAKRLFTPEIKRYLKAWLVRRRDNPYPSREEKKDLAYQTGLTYIQICNWFANWRRKLKNTGKEVDCTTWSTLIKTYNGLVDGHVEQFSISSEDSIWQETDASQLTPKYSQPLGEVDHSYTTTVPQCFHISSTTDFPKKNANIDDAPLDRNGNYPAQQKRDIADEPSHPLLLSRWLQSASKFQPRHDNYIPPATIRINTSKLYEDILASMHGREELAAAVALTSLSRASRV